jgi:hypothetical protein
MYKSDCINELAAALCKAQSEIEGAREDCKNDYFRSKYADLASVWQACKKALVNNNLAVTQIGDTEGEQPYLVTTLMHSSGQWISGRIPLILEKEDKESEKKKSGPNMQKLGSAITYARRYGLAAIVGVCPEDDDGNMACNKICITPDQAAEINLLINGYDHIREKLLKWLNIKSISEIPYDSFLQIKQMVKLKIAEEIKKSTSKKEKSDAVEYTAGI